MSSRNYKLLRRLAYIQLALYVLVWLFGIYINGFVSSGNIGFSFLFSPVVIVHFTLAAAVIIVGIMLESMFLLSGLGKSAVLNTISLACLGLAVIGGLTIIFGIGIEQYDSMLMATGYITALYLGFLSMLFAQTPVSKHVANISTLILLSFAALVLYYTVFLSGMYTNLFVAASVFSEPPNLAREMLAQMVTSIPVLIHETSSLFLLLVAFVYSFKLFDSKARTYGVLGLLCSLFVLYSLIEGTLMNILPIFQSTTIPQSASMQFIEFTLAPMLSAAGFMVAIVITLVLTEKLWAPRKVP